MKPTERLQDTREDQVD